jgi:streptogramin lyase
LFIADEFNNRIRMVNATGTITTFAGNGSFSDSGDGGPATSAGVYEPQGLALDHGTVYISTSSRIRRVKISTGIIDAYAGNATGGYDGDGHPLLSSEFAAPLGLFFTPDGNLVVVDWFNTRLREATGGVMETVAGGYIGDGGPALSAALVDPEKVAFDKAGNYYIADSSGNRIRKVSKTGKITTVAGTGISGYSGDGGPATSATLWGPYGVAIDSSGNIFFADSSNFVIRKVDTSGNISTFASNSSFVGLGAMATDSLDNVYVADLGSCVVWKISPAGAASIVAGVWFSCGYNGDNISATTAELNLPFGMTVDSKGNILIADTYNNRIRKVNSRGIITTVAGDGTCGFSGDGGPATAAQLCHAWGVAVNAAGAVYFADTHNIRIRKVSRGTITTYAGTGASGFNGDGLPALSTNFDSLVGVTVDPHGAVFVVDSARKLVRKIH